MRKTKRYCNKAAPFYKIANYTFTRRKYMNINLFKDSQNSKFFFENYAPNVKNWSKKNWGKNSNGNPVTFTSEDEIEIETGLKKLFSELLKK